MKEWPAAILIDHAVSPHASAAELRGALASAEALAAEQAGNPYHDVRDTIATHVETYRRWLAAAQLREWTAWFHQPRPGFECWPLFGSRG